MNTRYQTSVPSLFTLSLVAGGNTVLTVGTDNGENAVGFLAKSELSGTVRDRLVCRRAAEFTLRWMFMISWIWSL